MFEWVYYMQPTQPPPPNHTMHFHQDINRCREFLLLVMAVKDHPSTENNHRSWTKYKNKSVSSHKRTTMAAQTCIWGR